MIVLEGIIYPYLGSTVDGVVVDDDLVYLAVLAKVLIPLEYLWVGQPGGEANHKHKVPLHHSASTAKF